MYVKNRHIGEIVGHSGRIISDVKEIRFPFQKNVALVKLLCIG